MQFLYPLLAILGSYTLGVVLERYIPNAGSTLFPNNPTEPKEPQ